MYEWYHHRIPHNIISTFSPAIPQSILPAMASKNTIYVSKRVSRFYIWVRGYTCKSYLFIHITMFHILCYIYIVMVNNYYQYIPYFSTRVLYSVWHLYEYIFTSRDRCIYLYCKWSNPFWRKFKYLLLAVPDSRGWAVGDGIDKNVSVMTTASGL